MARRATPEGAGPLALDRWPPVTAGLAAGLFAGEQIARYGLLLVLSCPAIHSNAERITSAWQGRG